MPLLHYRSLIKANNDDSKLTLQVCHSLFVGKDLAAQTCLGGSPSYELKRFLPTSMDIFSRSDLTIDISVIVNKHRLSGEFTRQSAVTRHLIQLLRKNASLLGINSVSDAYIEERDGQVKVNVTPTRSVPHENSQSQLSLLSISLLYHYTTTLVNSSSGSDLPDFRFSLELLNQIGSNFVTNHLTKRYPLIFGPLAEKFEHEKPYFGSIARSLLAMARRSPNDAFRKQVKRYTKILSRRLREYQFRFINDLRKHTDQLTETDGSLIEKVDEEMSDESIICGALCRLFRLVLRPPSVRCTPVSEDAIDAYSDDWQVRSLSPPLVLHEGHEYDSTVDVDDEMYYSELEDAATGPAESWNFMSRPPPPVGIGSDLCYGSEDNLLLSVARRAAPSSMRIENPDRITSRETGCTMVNNQDSSYPCDSDSESLTITVLEDNSSTLGSERSLDGRATTSTLFRSISGLEKLGTLPSDSQSRNDDLGYKKDEFPRSSSPDQDLSQSFSRCTGIGREPVSFWFSDADQELDFGYDDFSSPKHPEADKDKLITGPTEQLLEMSRTDLLYTGIPPGTVPRADIPASSISFAIAVDEDADSLGLDYSDEEEGEEWGHATRGRTFCAVRFTSHSAQDSHTSGPVPLSVLVASPLEKVGESDDQLYYPEGTPPRGEIGPAEPDGEFDTAMEMEYDDEHDGDLGLEGEDEFDEICAGPMEQCYASSISGRAGEVGTDGIFDSEDEEEGECRWSLVD